MGNDLLERPWLSRPIASRNGLFFWLGGFVVRVRYTFFLVALLAAMRRSVPALLVWMAVVFLAIVIHELGHALAARQYDADPSIELYSLGGLTSWTWVRPPTLVQSLVTSLAGPAAGFAAGGLAYGISMGVGGAPLPDLVSLAFRDFLWINLGWGLFNLLPVLPLDGGGVLDALFQARLGSQRGRHTARVVSCVVGMGAAVFFVASGFTWAVLLCLFYTYNNFMHLRGLPPVRISG